MNRGGRFVIILSLFLSPLLGGAQVEVKTLASAADLPEPFTAQAEKGDLFVQVGDHLFLLGGMARPVRLSPGYQAANARGVLLAFVPARSGVKNDIAAGSPVVRTGRKTEYLVYDPIIPNRTPDADGGLTLEARAKYAGTRNRKAAIRTTYRFRPDGEVEFVSVITNTGQVDIRELAYSLYFNAGSVYNFSPFLRDRFPALNFRVHPKLGLAVGWLNRTPLPAGDARQPGTLAPGQSFEVRYTLLVDTRVGGLLERFYELAEAKTVPAAFRFKNVNGRQMEVIVREAVTSAVFFASFLEDAPDLELPLPPGVYAVTANFFPAVVERLLDVGAEKDENVCLLEDPPQGTVKVRLRDAAGRHVPGKVTVLGLGATRNPYFAPDNPLLTGRSWERTKNSCYPGESGVDLLLPRGTYLFCASRGPEYGIERRVVEVGRGKNPDLTFEIDRLVDTRGYISVDTHLHTQNSDGATGIAERLRSVVAEGVDVAVATDHNYITDYGPTLKALGLEAYLAVIPGYEVTAPDSYIHFNAIGTPPQEGRAANGAISPVAGHVSLLIQAARAAHPGVLLELNHPRSGTLGLFNNADLDRESAAVANPNFDLDFDLLEVLNGPYFFLSNRQAVEDWFHLLNRGYVQFISGSSDSHRADGGEPGYSRTYVRYDGARAEGLDWSAVADALRTGRGFVSNGPFLELRVNGRHEPGDTFTERSGRVEVRVEVRRAPWVAVDEVRLVVNGERKLVFPVPDGPDAAPAFTRDIRIALDSDAYVVAEALGKTSLYPVVQRASTDGSLEMTVLPYAVTNPVFVDVDGNGRYDAPFKEKVKARGPAVPAGAEKATGERKRA
ncbi:MAG: CehA/McbA family metallohydrolase [Candidatus Aminicenantes bacterium]|nr:CehA/McbA family metallohydrolase [Candidatus Aminicenantes bacterium]